MAEGCKELNVVNNLMSLEEDRKLQLRTQSRVVTDAALRTPEQRTHLSCA